MVMEIASGSQYGLSVSVLLISFLGAGSAVSFLLARFRSLNLHAGDLAPREGSWGSRVRRE